MSRTTRTVPLCRKSLFESAFRDEPISKRKVKEIQNRNQRLLVFDGKSRDDVWKMHDVDERERLLKRDLRRARNE